MYLLLKWDIISNCLTARIEITVIIVQIIFWLPGEKVGQSLLIW